MIRYREAHPDWIFVRHEDVSRDPVEEFRKLYHQLGLEFSEQAEQAIKSFSNPANPSETDAPVGSEEILIRNSTANISNWKNRLTGTEIEKIRSAVEETASTFYSAKDW